MFGLYPPPCKVTLFAAALAFGAPVCAQSFSPPLLTPNLGKSLSEASGEAWVPVVLLSEQTSLSPLGDPMLLGFAQVKDIEDGFPYKVGLYRLGLSSPMNVVPGLTLSADVSQLQLSPVCQSPGLIGSCEPLIGTIGADERGSRLELGANYQLGDAKFRLGLGQADQQFATVLNPYLPWPSDSRMAIIPGASGTQYSAQLQSSLDTNFGRFGLGMSLAQASLRSQDMRQGNLSFNWFKGAFGTSLSTRLMEIAGTSALWGGLDLGLTWRTPWQGTLSLGARNLVVGGKPPPMLDPSVAADAESSERVPYVRYQQDL